MNNFRTFIFVFILLAVSALQAYSQKYISDSLIIQFGVFLNRTIPLAVDSVIDYRSNLQNTQVRISERKHYVYIPVDFYYVSARPIKQEIKSLFVDSVPHDTVYTLVIERFEINYRSGFLTLPSLIAHIEVYAASRGVGKQRLGTLIYETVGEKPKKNMEKEAFESLIEKWKDEFLTDMQKIKFRMAPIPEANFSNYITPKIKPSQSVFAQAAFVAGINWYMIDGDLGFFEPEATKRFFRQASFVRYRNEERYESIAFGSRNYYYYNRINERFVASIEQKLCIGVNRWKDMKTFDHKLYDIVNVNAGIRAGIYYYPFGKRTIIAGLVTTQDVYYIYCMGAFYKPGIGVSFGVNF